MSKTYSFKVSDERMQDHLDSQGSTSAYVRRLVESDMLTESEKLESELAEIREQKQEIDSKLSELQKRESEIDTKLAEAEEREQEIATDIFEFVESLITIQPDMRQKNVLSRASEIPSYKPGYVYQVVNQINLHYFDPQTGRVDGDDIDDDLEEAGYDAQTGLLSGRIDEEDDRWEFVSSLTPREREEIEDKLEQEDLASDSDSQASLTEGQSED